MLDRLIIGAVRGAINEAAPGLAQQAKDAVSEAHKTPTYEPLSADVGRPLTPEEIERRVLERLQSRPEYQQAQADLAPIPWYRSQVMVGAVIALAGPIVGLISSKTGLAPEVINSFLREIVPAFGAAIVFYGRVVKGTAQPVTLTARSAGE